MSRLHAFPAPFTSRYFSIWTILLVFLLAPTACSDDSDSGQLQDRDPPSISVDPPFVQFSEVAIGGQDQVNLTVSNNGRGLLRISNITLVENDEDQNPEFHRGQGWVNKLELAPGESHDITIAYRPLNQTSDSGYIEFTSNDPVDGNLRVPLQSPILGPKIFTPSIVHFGRAIAGTKIHEVARIQNIGQAPLRVDDIVLTGSEDFTISFPTAKEESELGQPETDQFTWPTVIAPGDHFLARIGFTPSNNEPTYGDLIFFTNDSTEPEYVVNLIGNSGAPCLAMNYEREIDFGASSIGQAATRTVVIENCSSNTPLRISDIEIVDDANNVFDIRQSTLPSPLPDDALILPPNNTANFAVTYTPDNEDLSQAKLRIHNNDPARSTFDVALKGSGTNNVCPTAIAEGRLVGTNRYQTEFSALPLNTIDLSGEYSTDPDGNISSYEWTIISRPDGSTARPSPGPDVMKPTLYLDLAGTYEIELVVYDNQGTASCGERAVVTIHAIPQDDVHIQLIWDAPAVINPRDGHGTDVDLHYLHPLGRWNEAPYDIFWNNRTADWGLLGDSTDDPRLDIDDLFAGGPENINHSNPEVGLDYGVGVYYFSDRGFGAAYATIRIYIRGELRYEVKNRYLPEEGHFWYAAVIRWPSTEIIRRDRIEYGFPTR